MITLKSIYFIPGLSWVIGLILGSKFFAAELFAAGVLLGFSVSFFRIHSRLGYLSFLWTFLCLSALLSSNEKLLREEIAKELDGSPRSYTAVIRSDISRRPRSQRLEVELLPGPNVFKKGIGAYLYFSMSDSLAICSPGDSIIFRSTLRPPEPFEEFDYRSFLQGEGIYYTGFVAKEEWMFRPGKGPNWRRIIHNYRERCVQAIAAWKFSEREEMLVKALLLGIRDGVPPDLKQDFAEIGVIHVLAVSGLHLGIWYLGWSYLLRFIPQNIRHLRIIVLIPMIWSFALITGASPSVVRAAAMFSIISVQSVIGSGRNSLDTIILSLILITAIDPLISSKIGFQLSYMAILGILWIYPWLDKAWTTSILGLKTVKSLAAVSISAQLATTPLSLYYFNRFPMLFLPANLLVVPLVTLTVYIGFAALICQLIGIFPYPMVLAINYLLKAILWFTSELSG
jgi:ComEC/Rec2-related protein